METQIIIYLLKASLSFAVFYFLYLFCFRNDTLLNIRRFYFLAVILFSLSFSFVNIELSSVQYNVISEFLLPVVTITGDGVVADTTVKENSESYLFPQIMLGVALIISMILFLKLIVQIISLLKLKRRLKGVVKHKYQYMYLEDKTSSSFSFFNWIFLNLNVDGIEKDEIIAHEEEHAKQFHSFDVLLIEMVCVLFWWNPFVWVIRREMKTNLEYLADRGVVNKGYDSYVYQYTLLQTINNNAGIPLINNFNVSQLKKRITMMNKEKTSIYGSVKYLLVLPLIFGLLMFNCSNEKENNQKKEEFAMSNIPIAGTSVPEHEEMVLTNIPAEGEPFKAVEEMPQYQGGETAMFDFIGDNLKYPTSAIDEKVQGRVIIRFVIAADGTVSDASILRGIHPDCDKEAIRVVNMMPKWIPGKQGGKQVPVYFTLPIIFKLS